MVDAVYSQELAKALNPMGGWQQKGLKRDVDNSSKLWQEYTTVNPRLQAVYTSAASINS